jgi:hypothetical protein
VKSTTGFTLETKFTLMMEDGTGDFNNAICKCDALWLDSYKKVCMQLLNQLNEQNEEKDIINKNTSICEEERIILAKQFLKIISEDYLETYNYFY